MLCISAVFAVDICPSACLSQSGLVSNGLTCRRNSFTTEWRQHSSFPRLIGVAKFPRDHPNLV